MTHPLRSSSDMFKPVGHVVVSVPTVQQAEAARQALVAAGLAQGGALHAYSDREMLAQTERDLVAASVSVELAYDLHLIKIHKLLSERGYHWLVVRAPRDREAQQIADICHRHGAERAHYYGRFIVEDLIVGGELVMAFQPDWSTAMPGLHRAPTH